MDKLTQSTPNMGVRVTEVQPKQLSQFSQPIKSSQLKTNKQTNNLIDNQTNNQYNPTTQSPLYNNINITIFNNINYTTPLSKHKVLKSIKIYDSDGNEENKKNKNNQIQKKKSQLRKEEKRLRRNRNSSNSSNYSYSQTSVNNVPCITGIESNSKSNNSNVILGNVGLIKHSKSGKIEDFLLNENILLLKDNKENKNIKDNKDINDSFKFKKYRSSYIANNTHLNSKKNSIKSKFSDTNSIRNSLSGHISDSLVSPKDNQNYNNILNLNLKDNRYTKHITNRINRSTYLGIGNSNNFKGSNKISVGSNKLSVDNSHKSSVNIKSIFSNSERNNSFSHSKSEQINFDSDINLFGSNINSKERDMFGSHSTKKKIKSAFEKSKTSRIKRNSSFVSQSSSSAGRAGRVSVQIVNVKSKRSKNKTSSNSSNDHNNIDALDKLAMISNKQLKKIKSIKRRRQSIENNNNDVKSHKHEGSISNSVSRTNTNIVSSVQLLTVDTDMKKNNLFTDNKLLTTEHLMERINKENENENDIESDNEIEKDDEDFESHISGNISEGIFNPESIGKTIWDFIALFFILYQALVTPVRISFNIQAEGFLAVFEIIQDLFFICDLFVSFNTGTYESGCLILDRHTAICMYLKQWFWIDLVSSFPYTLALDSEQYFELYPNSVNASDFNVNYINYYLYNYLIYLFNVYRSTILQNYYVC